MMQVTLCTDCINGADWSVGFETMARLVTGTTLP